MLKKLCISLTLLTLMIFVAGCEDAKKAGEKAKDAVASGERGATNIKKMAMEKAQFMKPMTDLYPKIEEKIKTLSGDKVKEAQAKFDDFKKMISEFKDAPGGKMGEFKEKMTKAFDELKKLVGL
ncbi:MAG: hypothetical protein ACRD36_08905 [Candidatus Acidiferrum sp.]